MHGGQADALLAFFAGGSRAANAALSDAAR